MHQCSDARHTYIRGLGASSKHLHYWGRTRDMCASTIWGRTRDTCIPSWFWEWGRTSRWLFVGLRCVAQPSRYARSMHCHARGAPERATE